uniref:Phospholipid-transporting ATPase n=1 Tax=Ascaris lumbricoides TaxID=6252 RepID=A0A9J2QAG0_ASCLU
MRPHLSVSILSMIITYSGLIPISLLVTLEMIALFQTYFIRQVHNAAEIREFLSLLAICHTVVPEKSKDGSLVYHASSPEFLSLLAICHTVVPEKSKDGSLVYHASSPDEAVLVACARQLKFFFHTRTPFCVYISAMGKEEKYEVLNVLEFTSTRRRMGVIVKSPSSKIKLYIKGAELRETSRSFILQGNIKGYRTLCMAVTELTDKEYMEWEPGYYRASIALDSREMLIEQQAEKIERNLRLLGATGIEDKLQEGVKATIANLALGGMNIWVLTGDKIETAQNIGFSCGLIKPDMPTLVCNFHFRRFCLSIPPSCLGVKATIANLALGGMNIWMLTGDKIETAQNIGFSCGLIKPDMPTLVCNFHFRRFCLSIPPSCLVISEGSPEKTRDRLRSYINDIYSSHCAIKIALIVISEGSPEKTRDRLRSYINDIYSSHCAIKIALIVISEGSPEKTRDRLRSYINDIYSSHCAIKIALIVSGQGYFLAMLYLFISFNHCKTTSFSKKEAFKSLGHLLKDMMDIEFFFLASRCSCVICCRCSPMQKAAVVKLIQNYCDGATLAVGDGANDVAMIQAADVGVGICGEEGMQASLAADYSIAQAGLSPSP